MKIDRGEISVSRQDFTDWLSVVIGSAGHDSEFSVSVALDGDRDKDHLRVAQALHSLARRLERIP